MFGVVVNPQVGFPLGLVVAEVAGEEGYSRVVELVDVFHQVALESRRVEAVRTVVPRSDVTDKVTMQERQCNNGSGMHPISSLPAVIAGPTTFSLKLVSTFHETISTSHRITITHESYVSLRFLATRKTP
uniref:Uncharacterized protein n=1 Tax=Lygus hesperus TaxID=30085 RepID=A0A0K8TJE1_LYGHE